MCYSTKRGATPEGAPVIELLRDGMNWRHPGAGCFRFGNRKCKMFLDCKPVLKTFVETEGINPEGNTQTVTPGQWLHAPVNVVGHTRFVISNGIQVDHPFLTLSCGEAKQIGVGLKKTKGLLSVWNDLEAFATEVGAP